ncbi:MAG TPA: zf-HC2 domain-containing protein [Thermoanaerobaculia bacterium]|nr:zf-HC2 domain-containing protein [Thermoanaerobaculia bacterium]
MGDDPAHGRLNAMDHQYVLDNGLIDLYRRGALPPEEEALFEEHFAGCAECLEQLEAARGFQLGLKALAAEDAARTVVQAGLLAWLLRRGRLALALAALLVAALPALWLLRENREMAQQASALREQGEAERQRVGELERRLAETEDRSAEERRKLEARIAQAKPPEEEPRAEGPLVNTPVFLLSLVRSEGGEPAATIDLGKIDRVLTLAVDPGADAAFSTYRATITGTAGRPVFREGGLKPNALETVMITFPARFFSPGDYRLKLEGLRADGTAEEIGGYPFRVVG